VNINSFNLNNKIDININYDICISTPVLKRA
jgi:hypothetical protein